MPAMHSGARSRLHTAVPAAHIPPQWTLPQKARVRPECAAQPLRVACMAGSVNGKQHSMSRAGAHGEVMGNMRLV